MQRAVANVKHRARHDLVRRQEIAQEAAIQAVVLRQVADQEVLVELVDGLRVDDGDVVVGYYTLSMGGVGLPRKLGRGLPVYEIGMVLLARLAITREYQGQGHGRDLLVAAVEEAAAAGQHAAARFIAVDPIDENARRFYAKFGFLDIRGDAGERMFMRIDQAIATFSTLET